MDPRSLIAGLRRGEQPVPDDIAAFAQGLASGSVSDAQAGAFAMAVCLKGLGEAGRVALTTAMRDSGDVLAWSLDRPVMDKHSTGGVGDCVSLILAPALAACGMAVPMISGRGLGHTGGTLDKLESIPGVQTTVSEDRLRAIIADMGCAIVSATGRIAPADKRLYAIRDVTGTVESVDLITASILSKKLAAGLQGLILDVKCGSGAFMKTLPEAKTLAQALVQTANGAGCPTTALITDMDEPLCGSLGNAVEVVLCCRVLAGDRAAAPRLHDLTVALGDRLLAQAGLPPGTAAAIADGRAMAIFARMVAALGGPPDMDRDWPAHLPQAPVVGEVVAPEAGQIAAWNGEALGLAVVQLGGGRQVETDRIDPAVGITDLLPVGSQVARGAPVATIHARTEAAAEQAARAIRAALTIGVAPPPRPLILAEVTG
jgi:thymidine phosphorylase